MNLSPGRSWACFLCIEGQRNGTGSAVRIFRGFLDFRQTVMIP